MLFLVTLVMPLQTIINHDQGNDIKPPENFPFSRYKFTTEKDWKKAFQNK
jgi:DNA (cytosine-5)-methyltransferase 1